MATQTSVEMNERLSSLQHQLNNIIAQMQICTQKLQWDLFLPKWKHVFFFLCLIVVSEFALGWGVYWILSLVLVTLSAVGVVIVKWKRPSPAQTVKELDRLATELKYKVNTLKQSQEDKQNAAWFSSFNSWWSSQGNLEVLAKDVMDLVTQLQSETRSDLISQLKEKLQKCQELVKKI